MKSFYRYATAIAFAFAGPTLSRAETITVYTGYEEDEVAAYLAAAKQDMPDLDIEVLRLSTGDLAARIIAEKDNPQHDVILGMAVTGLLGAGLADSLDIYRPPGTEKLPAQFRDAGGKWFGVTAVSSVFCVNLQRLKEKMLPVPTSWADLTQPIYKGEIIMPNAASSGGGYFQAETILQMKGETAGWAFLEKLDANVAQYIKSSSKPCNMASAGEYSIGTSFDLRAVRNIEEGYPIQMVIPAEGTGVEPEVNGLVATSTHKAGAKRFLDWLLSENAVKAFHDWKAVVAIPGGTLSEAFIKAGVPADIKPYMFDLDYEKASSDREQVIARWQSMFAR